MKLWNGTRLIFGMENGDLSVVLFIESRAWQRIHLAWLYSFFSLFSSEDTTKPLDLLENARSCESCRWNLNWRRLDRSSSLTLFESC